MTRTLRAIVLALAAFSLLPAFPGAQTAATRPPNVILILADDLGYGEIGANGQARIRTPQIDRLSREGLRFTDHYSGSPVCAPSRAVLLTGLHTGHAYIRDNDEMGDRGDVWRDPALEGQRPLPADTVTIASLLKDAGYATALVGKWGLGGPGSSGEPHRLGFDFFFGYLCQRVAHSHYPSSLWRNTVKVPLNNPGTYPHEKLPPGADLADPRTYARYGGSQYALDLMGDEARTFIRTNRARPFFLYFAPTVPHAALQVPDDSLDEYRGAFPETPYRGEKGYLPHPTPRAAYAAMVTRLDREVGRLVALVKELGLERDTLVLVTSDNGPTFNGGTDSPFFNSAGPLRGLKTMLYEGGIRVPLVAHWPGRVPAGSVSHLPSAFEDYLPTLTALAGAKAPAGIDGVSLVPTLEGRAADQRRRDYLYWEFQGRQAVRLGNWKALRTAADGVFELYDLASDIGEQHNVAAAHPEVVARITAIMAAARTESALFPLVRATRAP